LEPEPSLLFISLPSQVLDLGVPSVGLHFPLVALVEPVKLVLFFLSFKKIWQAGTGDLPILHSGQPS
jgi:hypothetical protein